MSKQRQEEQSATARINPCYLYRTIYTTEEEMRQFLLLCDKELELNSPVFRQELPKLMAEHEGEFVLMKGGEVLKTFSDEKEAYAEGNRRFKDCIFNVMKVEDVVYCLPSVSVDYRTFCSA